MPDSYGWQIQTVMLVQKVYVSKISMENDIFISSNKLNVQLMFLQDKDNSVQVSFKSGCHSLTPVLANFPSLSLFSFLITVIQTVLVKYLDLIRVSWHCKYIVKLYLRQMSRVAIPDHP